MAFRDTRRLASLVALGCLLGAATVVGTTFVSAPPASGSCTSAHQNVSALDADGGRYGNRGNIYVNSGSVINNLHDALYRSLFVQYDGRNWVEVGWGAGPNSITGGGPTVYAYWVNSGTPGQVIYKSLSEGSNRTFTVENVGHVEIWRYYFDSESSPFAYSPTMIFNSSTISTNSEHYNVCDSLWTHMYGLNYFSSGGDWRTWGDLECNYNDSTGFYLHKVSNSEIYVNQTSSGKLC